MKNHSNSEFGFLYYNLKYGKYRTQYYHTLGKLLFMEVKDENVSAFEDFMSPFANILNKLLQVSQQNPQQLRTQECKESLIGLSRDLRGICLACKSVSKCQACFNSQYQVSLFYNGHQTSSSSIIRSNIKCFCNYIVPNTN